MDIALLILRVVVGLYLFGHGAQKLFGWFGGGGMAGTSGFMAKLGFRPPRWWALNAGLGETVGGLQLALGFLNPVGSIAILAVMLVAIVTVHLGKGYFASTGGPELPIINMAVATVIAIAGPGRYALDSMLGIALPEPVSAVALGLVALIVIGVGLATRRRADEPQSATQPA
jgi:putative oxidoreductase